MNNGKTSVACPACSDGHERGPGMIQIGGKPWQCPMCSGAGVLPVGNGFPVPFWYPFNLELTATAVPGPPSITTAPVARQTRQVASEADFEWVMTLGKARGANGLDGAEFVRLQFQDVSSNFDFSNEPIDFDLFCGTGQLPFTTLENYLFGKKTQLKLSATPTLPNPGTQVIGVGTGAIATWTGTLPGPILPGSVSITDTTGTSTDDGNGAFTPNAGVTGGTINYQTGAVSITFAANTGAADNVTVTFQRGIATINVQVALYGFLLVEKKGVGAGQ